MKITRKDFLKAAGITAAGVVAAGCDSIDMTDGMGVHTKNVVLEGEVAATQTIVIPKNATNVKLVYLTLIGGGGGGGDGFLDPGGNGGGGGGGGGGETRIVNNITLSAGSTYNIIAGTYGENGASGGTSCFDNSTTGIRLYSARGGGSGGAGTYPATVAVGGTAGSGGTGGGGIAGGAGRVGAPNPPPTGNGGGLNGALDAGGQSGLMYPWPGNNASSIGCGGGGGVPAESPVNRGGYGVQGIAAYKITYTVVE